MKIAIYGGTFDPPHLGHELFIKAFIEKYLPDKMIVIPTKIPPHKACETTGAADRLAMARLAFKGIAEVSDCEIRRKGKSYTVDTLELFKRKYPDADIFFIIGSDMLLTFDEWRCPRRILELATVVAAPRRKSAELVEEMRKKAKSITEALGGKIEIIPLSPKEISSTEIREGAESAVSPAVLEYIEKKGLYNESAEIKKVKEVLSKRLSYKRYYHSLGVMNTAAELAARYGEDVERARLAGILHDCTKEYPAATHYEIIERYKVDVPKDELGVEKLLHSKTGAVMAKEEFGVTDKEILSAISCHTAGKENMTTFEKILFLADFIDPSRDYRGVEAIRKKAFRDLDEAIVDCTSFTVKDLAKRKKTIALNTLLCYNSAVRAVNAKRYLNEKEKDK